MSMRMRSREKASEQEAKRWAWRASIALVLIIGLFPLVGAFLGEIVARILGCAVNFPIATCANPDGFFASFANALMSMIAWAIISVPMAALTLVGLYIVYTIQKKREENGS
ncbi:MAG: hypothetical protein AAF739_11715 [Pseudomonadota bacterium]